MKIVIYSDFEDKVYFQDGSAMSVGEWYEWEKEETWVIVLTKEFASTRLSSTTLSQYIQSVSETSYVNFMQIEPNISAVYSLSSRLVNDIYSRLHVPPRGIVPYELAVQDVLRQQGITAAVVIERIGSVLVTAGVGKGQPITSRKSVMNEILESDLFTYFNSFRTRVGMVPEAIISNSEEVLSLIRSETTEANIRCDSVNGFLVGQATDFAQDHIFISESHLSGTIMALQAKGSVAKLGIAAVIFVVTMATAGYGYFGLSSTEQESKELDTAIMGLEEEIQSVSTIPAVQQAEVTQLSPDLDLQWFTSEMTRVLRAVQAYQYTADLTISLASFENQGGSGSVQQVGIVVLQVTTDRRIQHLLNYLQLALPNVQIQQDGKDGVKFTFQKNANSITLAR